MSSLARTLFLIWETDWLPFAPTPQSGEQIKKVAAWFAQSADHNIIYTFRNEKENKDVYMVALRDEDGTSDTT